MKAIFICSLMILCAVFQSAAAQQRVPAGCFVTDAVRTLYSPFPPCFNEERAVLTNYTTDHGYTEEEILALYGFQYGVLNNWSTKLYYDWQDAESRVATNKRSSDTHYDWYVTEFNRNKKLKALEVSLRRACGKKCKKIKTVKSFGNFNSEPSKLAQLPTAEGRELNLTFAEFAEKR